MLDDAKLAQLEVIGFTSEKDEQGQRKIPVLASDIYAKTGKLYTTRLKEGWVSNGINDPDKTDPKNQAKTYETWQEACFEVFLNQKGVDPNTVLDPVGILVAPAVVDIVN